MNKKILVTGCAGFIGSQVCKFLNKKYDLYGVDDFSTGLRKNLVKGVKILNHNNFKKKKLENSIKLKFDTIIHCAGQSSGEKSFWDPENDFNRNFLLTKKIINFAMKTKVRKFIYLSSMSVYGEINGEARIKKNCKPKSYYGLNKLMSENYISFFENKIDFTILRLFNVYGPGQDLNISYQGMVSIFLSDMIKNNKITVKGSLKRYRDFIFIDDVVNIIDIAIKNKKLSNRIINVGTSEKITVQRLLTELSKLHLKYKRKKTKIINLDSTPGDQFGIYSDKEIFKVKKNFTILKKGLSKFYKYAVKEINK
jgi:UDP-glucose 4-epimerase